MLLNKDSNYFELLNIDEHATERDIRVAYAKMLRQYSNEKYPEEFQLITKAYQTLIDDKKREQYAKEIGNDGAYEKHIKRLKQHLDHDDFYKAKKVAQQLMQEGFSEDESVLLYAMYIAKELDDTEEEKKYAEKLGQLYRESERVQSQLMYYYSRDNNYPKAIYYAEQQYEKHPLNNEHILNLVTLYYRNNETLKVDDLFKKSLQMLEPRVQNNVVFIEALFWGINNDKPFLVKEVEAKFDHMIASGQKLSLLQQLVDNGEDLYTDHYAFKYFTLLVERLNDNEYDFAREWTKHGRTMFEDSIEYYGDEKRIVTPTQFVQPVQEKSVSPKVEQIQQNTYNVVEKERGSIFWSFVFGLIACVSEESILIGAAVGLIWYLFASKIKALIGCLLVLIMITVIILFFVA